MNTPAAQSHTIEKILAASKLEDILDVNNLKVSYRETVGLIHPDVCSHPKASEATAKLNALKEKYEKGTTYYDEAGSFISNGYKVTYTGDASLLKRSLDNFNKLTSLKDEAAQNFRKYMPKSMRMEGDKLVVEFERRAIPIVNLTLPQIHVNWALSRMLEFSAWLSQVGYSHCGLNPESVFIVPETHGIQVCSFYMMQNIGKKVAGVSGRYLNWYPPHVFDTKKADDIIDMELSKRTAVYLLGDKSGSGVKLRREKDVNQEMLDFMISQHDNPGLAWKKYRELLSKNFEKKFHILNNV